MCIKNSKAKTAVDPRGAHANMLLLTYSMHMHISRMPIVSETHIDDDSLSPSLIYLSPRIVSASYYFKYCYVYAENAVKCTA